MSGNRVPRGYENAAERVPRGISAGQYIAALPDEGTVVFLIGMHVNRWRKARSWWPSFIGMPRLLKELRAADAGLLAARSYWSGRMFLTVQYWRSAAELGAFARNSNMGHPSVWSAFNKHAAGTGDVGIFHESYILTPDGVESLYGNMPQLGLAAACGWVPRAENLRRNEANEKLQTTDPQFTQT